MDIDQFESLMLHFLLSALIIFMGFIIWGLAKHSKVGRLGTLVLFSVLGFGILGFVLKEIIIYFIHV